MQTTTDSALRASSEPRTIADDQGASPPLLFDATLYPHRSLPKKRFHQLMMILTAGCLVASLRFIIIGAWPVAVFVAFDIAALWFAFRLTYRSGRLYETLRLNARELTLTRRYPDGATETWQFEPYWLQLECKHDDTNHLALVSHGRCVPFADFLTAGERAELYHALRGALAALKS